MTLFVFDVDGTERQKIPDRLHYGLSLDTATTGLMHIDLYGMKSAFRSLRCLWKLASPRDYALCKLPLYPCVTCKLCLS